MSVNSMIRKAIRKHNANQSITGYGIEKLVFEDGTVLCKSRVWDSGHANGCFKPYGVWDFGHVIATHGPVKGSEITIPGHSRGISIGILSGDGSRKAYWNQFFA